MSNIPDACLVKLEECRSKFLCTFRDLKYKYTKSERKNVIPGISFVNSQFYINLEMSPHSPHRSLPPSLSSQVSPSLTLLTGLSLPHSSLPPSLTSLSFPHRSLPSSLSSQVSPSLTTLTLPHSPHKSLHPSQFSPSFTLLSSLSLTHSPHNSLLPSQLSPSLILFTALSLPHSPHSLPHKYNYTHHSFSPSYQTLSSC